MRIPTLVVITIALIFLVAGSGCEQKQQQKSPESRRLAADVHPKSNPLAGLTPSVVDTLRAKRRIYNVTRDEYWDDKGGVLGNKYFDVWYPPGRVAVTHGMYVLEEAMIARRQFHRTFGAVPEQKLNLVISTDMTNYLARTGREWWYYAVVKEDTVVFQPAYVLVKRGLGPIAITHEYAQWAMERLSRQRAPRWLVEGLASLMSNEASVLINQLREFDSATWPKTLDEIETILKAEEERQASRIAYYHAYKMVDVLQAAYGYEPITQFIIQLGETDDRDALSRSLFNKSYQDLVAAATRYEIDAKE